MSQIPQKSCSQCRARKRKCDMRLPRCSNCVDRGTICEFSQRKRPGPPKGFRRQYCQSFQTRSSEEASDAQLGSSNPSAVTLPDGLVERPTFQELSDFETRLLGVYDSMRRFPYLPPLRHERFHGEDLGDEAVRILIDAACAVSVRSSAGCALNLSHDMRLETGDVFAKRARSAFLRYTGELDLPVNLHIIKTALILAFYDMAVAEGAKSWLLVGQAARLAVDLGLDKLDNDWQRVYLYSSSEDIEDARYVWWCIFTLDSFVSSMFFRPFAINEGNFNTATITKTSTGPILDGTTLHEPLYLPHDAIGLQRGIQSLKFDVPLASYQLFLLVSSLGRLILTARRQQLHRNELDQQMHVLENTLATFWFAIPCDLIEQATTAEDPYLKLLRVETFMMLHLQTLSLHSYVLLQSTFHDSAYSANETPQRTYMNESNFYVQSSRWKKCMEASLGISELVRRLSPGELCQMSPTVAAILWLPAVALILQMKCNTGKTEDLSVASALEVCKAALKKLASLWRIAQRFHDALYYLINLPATVSTEQEIYSIMCSYTSPLIRTNGIKIEVQIPPLMTPVGNYLQEDAWSFDLDAETSTSNACMITTQDTSSYLA